MSDARTRLGNPFVPAGPRREFPKKRIRPHSKPEPLVLYISSRRPEIPARCHGATSIQRWFFLFILDLMPCDVAQKQMTFSLKRYSIQRCWHRWRKRLVQDEARNCAMRRGAGWFRCRPNFFLEPQDDWPASSSPASLEAEQGCGMSICKCKGVWLCVNFSEKQRNKMQFPLTLETLVANTNNTSLSTSFPTSDTFLTDSSLRLIINKNFFSDPKS